MAQVVVITSGKGGVGKSTVSVFLGRAMAAQGKRVLLMEMDSGLRGLDLMLGMGEQIVYDLSDLLTGRCIADHAVVPVPSSPGMEVLCAPNNSDYLPDPKIFVRLVDFFRSYYDVILIDTPAGLGKAVRMSGAAADMSLVVTTPDPVAARDAAKVSQQMNAMGMKHQRLIINRVPPDFASRGIVEDLDDVINIVGVQLIGVVPFSPLVEKSALTGIELAQSVSARAFDNIGRRLEGQYVPLAFPQ